MTGCVVNKKPNSQTGKLNMHVNPPSHTHTLTDSFAVVIGVWRKAMQFSFNPRRCTCVRTTGCPSSLIEPNSHSLARNGLISEAQLPERLQSIIAQRTETLVRYQTGANGPMERDRTRTERFNRRMSITNHKSGPPTGRATEAGCRRLTVRKNNRTGA